MRIVSGSLLLLPALLSLPLAVPAPDASQPALALYRSDRRDWRSIEPDCTVVIRGDRISAVGKSGEIRIPKDATVVDETGKFLIPGLWDMHVHFGPKEDLALFIANGITGVRIMWGSPEHYEWRKEIEDGELLGPRLVIASAIVDGPAPYWPGSISVSNEARARQVVVEIKKQGADFVKVYQGLPRNTYFAIADESKKEGIPFEGHVPLTVFSGGGLERRSEIV